jgi:hypothetical protein
MPNQDFITGPFGSAVPVATPVAPEAGIAGSGTPLPDVARVALTDASVAGDRGFGESRRIREERASRPDSTILEGMGAAVMSWDTTRLVKRIGRPTFDNDTEINQFEYLQNLPMQLSKDEHEFFTDTAFGQKSAAYAVQVIQDRRMALQTAGDHPVAGLATTFLDPLWLAVPPSVKIGKLSPMAGRAVSAAASGALGAGVMLAGEGPVSDEEIALGMVMNSIAGAAFYREGKGMVNADPDFPGAEMGQRIDAMVREQKPMQFRKAEDNAGPSKAVIALDDPTAGDELAASGVSTVDLRGRGETPEKLVGGHKYRTFIDEIANGPDATLAKAARTLLDSADSALWDIPVRLSGNARAYVSHGGFAVLRKDSSPFTIMHEAVHVATIRPIQTLIDGNAHLLGAETRKGVEGLDALFQKLRKEWEAETGKKAGKDSPDHVEYAFRNLHEFTAQAASSADFQKWLSGKAGAGGQSAWREFVQHVAKLLGINATGSKLDEVLDSLDTLLKARDTQYKDRSGKVAAYAPNVPRPFLHDFSNVFDQTALDNAKRYAGRADDPKGRVVLMPVDDFLRLAYPRERTYRDLTDAQRLALAEEKRGPIRAAITKGGLDEVPFLTMDGEKVVGHEGRHRADVLRENYFDEIPVVLKGKVPPPGSKLISETGDVTVDLPPAVLRDMDVRVAMAPEELRPGAVNTEPAAVVKAVDKVLAKESKARGLGEKLMWNMHKTMGSFGTAGKRIANILYDNNADLSHNSMESHREAILSDLRRSQFEYEDMVRKTMAENGYGTLKMLNPFTSREAYAMQAKIEREVQLELFRREQMARSGVTVRPESVQPNIAAMADTLDKMHSRALAEMKAAGIEGSENLLERPGYLNRKWNSAQIDDVIERLKLNGLSHKQAHGKVVDLVAASIRGAKQMDEKLSKQIGGAIVDRALRKGYFEDSVFNSAAGEGQLKELRDILMEGGMDSADIERALNVLRVAQDEAGKVGFMKHRMDLDYNATMRIGRDSVNITDLIDSRVSQIVDQYNQRVATNIAFAKMGLKKRSDIEALREELLKGTPIEQRAEAKDLFDNTIAYYRGEPNGAKISDKFRLYQTYARSISLAWSGLWQMTEYATAMGEYGLGKTLKYAAQEFPGFKQIMNPSESEAMSLQNVLADHSVQSLRLRPFLSRFEDGYEMNTGHAMQLSAQTAGQLVPMMNAMKYVHHHQAKMVGNLILDRVQQAAGGNAKARAALAKYGLEAPVMDKLAAEIKAKGLEVDKWDDAVWSEVRPAFAKMMDASVLKGRLGDVPAFAAFDPIGKFIFTYRTFVLAAHNKVMAGTLARDGAGAVGLILLYQFPLSLAAVQAQSVVKGDGLQSNQKLINGALGQMGGLGLFSEPLKWATGQSNAWGASGLIPVDRGIKLFQSAVNLDPNAGASTAMTMLPVVSAIPFMRGMAQQIKE